MIYKGQQVFIKPEYQDKGDEQYTWFAVSDEEKGRVDVSPQIPGFSIQPVYTFTIDMLKGE